MRARAILILTSALLACSSSPKTVVKSEAEDAVRHELRDPDSAQFRYRYNDMEVFPEAGVVCGEVNARNGFGGLTGFQDFVYIRGQGVAFSSADAAPGSTTDRYLEFVQTCTRLLGVQTREIQNRTREIENGLNSSAGSSR